MPTPRVARSISVPVELNARIVEYIERTGKSFTRFAIESMTKNLTSSEQELGQLLAKASAQEFANRWRGLAEDKAMERARERQERWRQEAAANAGGLDDE